MPRSHTHTVSVLEVSASTFDEIATKLRDARYHHLFSTDPSNVSTIDMTGIGLECAPSGPRPLEGSQCEFCTRAPINSCMACRKGSVHMNIAEPFPGYTSERTGEVDWSIHNAKGSHHVMWNGSENETIPCGSKRANELADRIIGKEAIETQAKQMDKMVDRVVAGLANARQVAGSHYSGYPLQHWDLVAIFDWDYFQGQITKYLMRWKKKNGIQDLEKAAHFLEKYIEVEKGKTKEATIVGSPLSGGGSWSGGGSASGGSGGGSR